MRKLLACFCVEERLPDFELYQFGAGGETLSDYSAAEAAAHGAAGVETLTVNEIPLALYYSEEQYGGKALGTATAKEF